MGCFGETVQVNNEHGVAVPVSLDRDQIFSADVFSQNEIEEIAADTAAQLELLDRFEEAESVKIARELAGLETQLWASGEALQVLDGEIEDVSGRALELPVLEEKLKGFSAADGPDARSYGSARE